MGLEEHIAPELTIEHGGVTIPLRDHPLVKETPDVTTAVKRLIDNHSEVGRRIPLPKADSKPEDKAAWRKEHLGKFQEAGVLDKPPQLPESADKYEVKYKSDALSKLVKPELVTALQQAAHKHGLTQEAVAELTALNEQQFAGIFEVIGANEEKSRAAVEQLAKEFNKPGEQLMAAADTWLGKAGYTQEQVASLKTIGLLMDAPVLDLIVRAAMNSGESDGLMGDGAAPGGDDDGMRLLAEFSDPKNPQHQAYLAENGKGPINDKINAAFAKRGGNREFVISG